MSTDRDTVTIWINPRCTKCRAAEALLRERDVEFQVRRYLEDPPTRAELEHLLKLMGARDPNVMIRKKESIYAELGLAGADRDTLLDTIVAHPELLERPIVIRGGRAMVARPPERLLDLL